MLIYVHPTQFYKQLHSVILSVFLWGLVSLKYSLNDWREEVHTVFTNDPSLNASIHIRLLRTTWNSGSRGIWHLWHLKPLTLVCIHAHPPSPPPNTGKYFSKLLDSSPSNNQYRRCPLADHAIFWIFDSQVPKPFFPYAYMRKDPYKSLYCY